MRVGLVFILAGTVLSAPIENVDGIVAIESNENGLVITDATICLDTPDVTSGLQEVAVLSALIEDNVTSEVQSEHIETELLSSDAIESINDSTETESAVVSESQNGSEIVGAVSELTSESTIVDDVMVVKKPVDNDTEIIFKDVSVVLPESGESADELVQSEIIVESPEATDDDSISISDVDSDDSPVSSWEPSVEDGTIDIEIMDITEDVIQTENEEVESSDEIELTGAVESAEIDIEFESETDNDSDSSSLSNDSAIYNDWKPLDHSNILLDSLNYEEHSSEDEQLDEDETDLNGTTLIERTGQFVMKETVKLTLFIALLALLFQIQSIYQ